MASNVLIGQWATGLWTDLGQPASLSALTISGYAVQPGTLGRLNTLIGTCYSGSGLAGTGLAFDTSPELTNTELSLIEGMFRVSYYNQLAMTMMGTNPADIAWTSIAEGDSRIARGSSINVGKEYREMAKETQRELDRLVNSYVEAVQGGSSPRSVDFLNPGYPSIAFPYSTPGGVIWRG